MEHSAVKKWVKTFGIAFILISLVELINIYLLFNTKVNINGKEILMQKLIFNTNKLPITSAYLFIFLICITISFLIMGCMLIIIVTKKNIDSNLLAKYLLILGVLILVFSYIKMGYIAYLEKAQINIDGNRISFKYFILKYNQSIFGPYDLLVNWTFYTSVVCCYLTIGLIMSGGGLSYILELKEKTPSK